jgi:hypothetical protein
VIELLKNNYLRASGSGNSFRVDLDKLPHSSNYYLESKKAAEEIWNKKTGNLYVMYSGGIDSEYALSVFLDLKIPVVPVIIKLMPNYNAHDIEYAVKFCKKKKIKPLIIELDFDNFVKSGKMLDIALETKSAYYQRCSTAWAAGTIDGTVICGDGEPYFNLNTDTKEWSLVVDEHDYAVVNYFKNHNINGVVHFNRYTPEMLSSFVLDPQINDLANNRCFGKLGSNSTKHLVYNRNNNFNLEPRPKFHGYEKIEQSEIFKHESFREFEKFKRIWNGVYRFNYQSLIEDYINVC